MYYLLRIVQNPIHITLCDTFGYYVAIVVFSLLVGIMGVIYRFSPMFFGFCSIFTSGYLLPPFPYHTFFSSFYLGMMLLGVEVYYLCREGRKICVIRDVIFLFLIWMPCSFLNFYSVTFICEFGIGEIGGRGRGLYNT